ncbi:MAG: DUF4440 domain-containing protein [Chitinophagales bacterium]
MQRILLSLLVILLYANALSKNKMEKEIEKLRQTELAFSRMSVEKGMAAAFIFYADKDVVKLGSDGQFPIIGKDALIASFADKPPKTSSLEWSPVRVEISRSADLGYTFGNWIFTTATGEKSYGVYMTVWKKQADSSWKYILDGGSSTPAPETKNKL